MTLLHNQIILVIGASSGIGHEVARQTIGQGARVTIVGRNVAKLVAAAKRLGGAVNTVTLDAHNEGPSSPFS